MILGLMFGAMFGHDTLVMFDLMFGAIFGRLMFGVIFGLLF